MPNNVNGGLALPPEMLSVVERYAVYRCYSDGGQLLYVGATGTMGRRLSDHLNKAWFTEVRGMTFEWYADELDALNAERRAIHVEHPKHNVIHRNMATLRPSARPPAQKAAASSRARRTPEHARKAALRILQENPAISSAQLGLNCGMSRRWGQEHRAELVAMLAAFSGAGEDDGQDAEAAE